MHLFYVDFLIMEGIMYKPIIITLTNYISSSNGFYALQIRSHQFPPNKKKKWKLETCFPTIFFLLRGAGEFIVTLHFHIRCI